MWAIRLGPCVFYKCLCAICIKQSVVRDYPHHYTTTNSFNHWWGGSMDSCCSNYDPTICMSQQNLRFIRQGDIFPIFHYPLGWTLLTWVEHHMDISRIELYICSIRKHGLRYVEYGICRIFRVFLNHIKKHVKLIYVIYCNLSCPPNTKNNHQLYAILQYITKITYKELEINNDQTIRIVLLLLCILFYLLIKFPNVIVYLFFLVFISCLCFN